MKRPVISRFIILLVIGLILVPLKVSAAVSDFTAIAHTKYSECTILPRIFGGGELDVETFNKIKHQLPEGAQRTNIKGLGFNFVIWHDKGIVVYGDYTSVPNNSFKAGTKGSVPYYVSNGVAGEYRYYGYDALGNRFTNMNFKDDVYSSLKLDQRQWVYEPWNSLRVKNADKTGATLKENSFNYYARSGDTYIQSWLNAGLPQLQGAFDNAYSEKGSNYNPGTDKQIWNFLNILSVPTPRFDGSGRMWRLAEGGYICYQTFPIKKFKKEHTPVTGTIEVENLEKYQGIIDGGGKNPAGWESETHHVVLKINAELDDSKRLANKRDYHRYYNRDDIINNGWQITLNSPMSGVTPVFVKGSMSQKDNMVTCYYKMAITNAQLRVIYNNPLNLSGAAKVNYADREFDTGSIKGVFNPSFKPLPTPAITLEPTPSPIPGPKPDEPSPSPVLAEAVHIDVDLPIPAFDVVEYKPVDNTTLENAEIIKTELFINGEPVDYETFFSGGYTFGEDNDGWKNIIIRYKSDRGTAFEFNAWRYVYDTKPIAQFSIEGSFKQNRLLKVADTSPEGNVKIVTDNYPIKSYQWSYRGVNNDGTSRRIRDISSIFKELMYKKPGIYEIELVVTNTLGRVSDPHIVTFQVYEDYKPAVDIGMNATDVARGETLSSYSYGAASTDGDSIASNIIELWYDSDNNGTYDRKLNTYDGKLGFPSYKSTALGKYKFINIVTEAFGEPTMPEYITPEDTVCKTAEVEFTVDNYRPSTDIFVDIPIVRPFVDALILLDANLNTSKNEYIKSHRMDYNNYLRGENTSPTVEMWDMRTYVYSQPASTSSHTGDSYPPGTIPYTSNGYSGTLNLQQPVTNNSYTRDEGHYESTTDSISASHSESQSGEFCTSCSSGTSPAYPTSGGSWSYSDSSGYTGSLPLSNYSYSDYNSGYCSIHKSVGIVHFTRTWQWSGTATKTVQQWKPNIVTYNDYTGFYNGTIYKYVRQPYTAVFTPNACKYIIYISDGTVSEPADLQTIRGKADAKLILIGSDAIRNQVPHDYFIPNNGRSSDALMDEALKIIAQNNPSIPRYTVLAGVDTFNTKVVSFDEENDPVIEQNYQYVHDCMYYDNSTGINPHAVAEPSSASGWTSNKLNIFAKVGKYEIYTRAKDKPSADPNFDEYSYYSGTPYVTVYAHRKPIAEAALDWDYDAARNVYKTKWADLSYDLDHNLSMANKGIADRKIIFRKDGGEWLYYIPSELVWGNYEVQYYVKDVEGAWSDPWNYNFTLAPSPAIQLKCDLRSYLPAFGIDSAEMKTSDLTGTPIPSTEALTDFNIWTRYPYSVKIQSGFWNGSSYMAASSINTSNYSASGNDRYWGETTKAIPPRKDDGSYLSDGVYTYRISAKSEATGLSAYRDFYIRISTPINMIPAMPHLVMTGDNYTISSSASMYTKSVSVLLYAGTPYQMSVAAPYTSFNGTGKTFSVNHLVPQNIPPGNYTAVFTATAVNGGSEVKSLSYMVETLQITGVSIKGYWNHWRGQADIFGKQMTNEPHRFLSYETVKIDVATIGNPERVAVEFSPELQAMQFTDRNGNVYDYMEAAGKHVKFPLQLNMTAPNTATTEYILPLAPSTKDTCDNRLRPAYWMKITAYKGSVTRTYLLDGSPGKELIDITGNIYDHVYIQPVK